MELLSSGMNLSQVKYWEERLQTGTWYRSLVLEEVVFVYIAFPVAFSMFGGVGRCREVGFDFCSYCFLQRDFVSG